ncbi:MAG: pyridoxamine 5'-phosphate oxidase family protein [Desulfobacteraceae bacterium]|nr:pyridoxamine 5'-phosphate oxidase family protein [Desulfobacteraceae bacterium]
MFREMRRKEKQLPMEETLEIIKKGDYGVLSTVGTDGRPYAVPINYACHDGKIYFHCAMDGHKVDNMEVDPRVSFCVVGDTEIVPKKFSTFFRSAVLFGTAKEVFDEEKETGFLALLNRYCKENMENGKRYMTNAWNKTRIYKIEIEHMTGKAGS